MSNTGVVIDANCISTYLYYEFREEENEIKDIINCILYTHGFALSPIIEQEWRNTAGGQLFNIWFDQHLVEGRIQIIEIINKLSQEQKRELIRRFGFPGGRDFHYINCSLNTLLKYILTNDIDFYWPPAKEHSSQEKKRIKMERNTRLCKYFKRNYEITIGRHEHCGEDLHLTL